MKKIKSDDATKYWFGKEVYSVSEIENILRYDPTEEDCLMALSLDDDNNYFTTKFFDCIKNPSEEVVNYYNWFCQL